MTSPTPEAIKKAADELADAAGAVAHAYWDIDQDGPNSPCVKRLRETVLEMGNALTAFRDLMKEQGND